MPDVGRPAPAPCRRAPPGPTAQRAASSPRGCCRMPPAGSCARSPLATADAPWWRRRAAASSSACSPPPSAELVARRGEPSSRTTVCLRDSSLSNSPLGGSAIRRGADDDAVGAAIGSERRGCSDDSGGSSSRTLVSISLSPLFLRTAITEVSSPVGRLGGRLRARSRSATSLSSSSSSSSSSSLTSNSGPALLLAVDDSLLSTAPRCRAPASARCGRGRTPPSCSHSAGVVAGDRLQVRRHLRRADEQPMARGRRASASPGTPRRSGSGRPDRATAPSGSPASRSAGISGRFCDGGWIGWA